MTSQLPPPYQHLPSLNRRPSPGSRREWVCERGGALKTSRSGGVWWGTPKVNGASSPPLLYAECASPLETGLFPVHARWCPLGSRKGALREQVPHPWHGWRARMLGRIIPGGAVGRRRMKPLQEAAAPHAPDPRGERVRPPDSATYLDPSFQNTAPPSQPAQHDEAPDPLFILDTSSPLDTILLFLLNKSLSEAWRHAHCVCRLLLPPQWWRMRARRSLDSAVGQHRWRHPLSLAEVHGNPHWDGGTTETASQPPSG